MRLHDVLTIAAALAAVIGMILLIRVGSRLVPALSPRASRQSQLSLEASLPLDPKRRLCLVRVQGRSLLLLTGGGADVMLGWLPGPDIPAMPEADAR